MPVLQRSKVLHIAYLGDDAAIRFNAANVTDAVALVGEDRHAHLQALRLALYHREHPTRNPPMRQPKLADAETVGRHINPACGIVDLAATLRHRNVRVFRAGIASLEEFCAALTAAGVPVTCAVTEDTDGNHRIRFTVAPEHGRFTFWKSNPFLVGEEGACHVGAPYHPAGAGKRFLEMINGDTDVFVGRNGGHALDVLAGVTSPEEARTEATSFSRRYSSWSPMRHPFKAEGSSFEAKLAPLLWHDRACVATVARMLTAALGRDPEHYIEVSGGFRAPERIADRLEGRRRPNGGEMRGSEAEAVWEYRTLVSEGRLDRRLVPAWLQREGWLAAATGMGLEGH